MERTVQRFTRSLQQEGMAATVGGRGMQAVFRGSNARHADPGVASSLQNWLRLYGYLPQPSRHMSTMRSAQMLASALAEMQRFYGIPVTGVLDEETKA